jgi:hypothetical protein
MSEKAVRGENWKSEFSFLFLIVFSSFSLITLIDDIVLVAFSLLCFGISTFFLTLSLNHQRVHRSEFSMSCPFLLSLFILLILKVQRCKREALKTHNQID